MNSFSLLISVKDHLSVKLAATLSSFTASSHGSTPTHCLTFKYYPVTSN